MGNIPGTVGVLENALENVLSDGVESSPEVA